MRTLTGCCSARGERKGFRLLPLVLAAVLTSRICGLPDTDPDTKLSDVDYPLDSYPPLADIMPKPLVDFLASIIEPGIYNAVQIWKAKSTDIFPTFRLPGGLNADPDSYKMVKCARKDVATCLLVGDAERDNLPEALQGIWWQDGIGIPSGPIGGGPFDAEKRRWTWEMIVPKRWAWDSYDPPWVLNKTTGTFPLSGALAYNFCSTTQQLYHVDFNEDFTFAQIDLLVFSPPFTWKVPHQLLNYTMSKVDENTWERKSAVLGWPTKEGTYTLKRLVDGKGTPIQPTFDEFLASQDGRDLMVAEVYDE